MSNLENRPLASVHGGHSGEFCSHARDSLEDIVKAYIEKGFTWVGITEHMPPIDDRFLAPDEIDAGLTARQLYARFRRYIETCRQLQRTYASSIKLYVGFETETYTGYDHFIPQLLHEFRPDYIVGSLHHVDNLTFDYSPAHYQQAADVAGGIDTLYCRYFDQQYEMIHTLKPRVVGHFDYIRIFDADYPSRLERPEIWARICRNLALIRDLDLILDFNLRALRKGASEPYVSGPILSEALALGIAIVPGDDSHAIAEAGRDITTGIKLLQAAGADTDWQTPISSEI